MINKTLGKKRMVVPFVGSGGPVRVGYKKWKLTWINREFLSCILLHNHKAFRLRTVLSITITVPRIAYGARYIVKSVFKFSTKFTVQICIAFEVLFYNRRRFFYLEFHVFNR